MGGKKSRDIFVCPNCKKIIEGSDFITSNKKNTSETDPDFNALRTGFRCRGCNYSGLPSRISNPTYWQLIIISILLITMSQYFPIPIVGGFGTGVMGGVLFLYTLVMVPKYKQS
jgi:hypothetical protein